MVQHPVMMDVGIVMVVRSDLHPWIEVMVVMSTVIVLAGILVHPGVGFPVPFHIHLCVGFPVSAPGIVRRADAGAFLSIVALDIALGLHGPLALYLVALDIALGLCGPLALYLVTLDGALGLSGFSLCFSCRIGNPFLPVVRATCRLCLDCGQSECKHQQQGGGVSDRFHGFCAFSRV